jgi:hypothetical protein
MRRRTIVERHRNVPHTRFVKEAVSGVDRIARALCTTGRIYVESSRIAETSEGSHCRIPTRRVACERERIQRRGSES